MKETPVEERRNFMHAEAVHEGAWTIVSFQLAKIWTR
jgi:hypothetical protein